MSNDFYYKKMIKIIETEPNTLRHQIAVQALKWENGQKVEEFINIIADDEAENYYIDYSFSEFFAEQSTNAFFDTYYEEFDSIRTQRILPIPYYKDLKRYLVCFAFCYICNCIRNEIKEEANKLPTPMVQFNV